MVAVGGGAERERLRRNRTAAAIKRLGRRRHLPPRFRIVPDIPIDRIRSPQRLEGLQTKSLRLILDVYPSQPEFRSQSRQRHQRRRLIFRQRSVDFDDIGIGESGLGRCLPLRAPAAVWIGGMVEHRRLHLSENNRISNHKVYSSSGLVTSQIWFGAVTEPLLHAHRTVSRKKRNCLTGDTVSGIIVTDRSVGNVFNKACFSMTPRIVDKDKKRQEILLAALRVFSRTGLKDARMIEIAREAGIGKGTIYEYFRSRDEMVLEAFSFIMEQMNAEIRRVFERSLTPEQKLIGMFEATYRALSEYDRDFLDIFVDFWAEGIRGTNKDGPHINLASIYHEYRQVMVAVLVEGIELGEFRAMDTTAVASALMAVIDGLLLQLLVDRQAFDTDAIIPAVIDTFLNGIRKHPSDAR